MIEFDGPHIFQMGGKKPPPRKGMMMIRFRPPKIQKVPWRPLENSPRGKGRYF